MFPKVLRNGLRDWSVFAPYIRLSVKLQSLFNTKIRADKIGYATIPQKKVGDGIARQTFHPAHKKHQCSVL
jgi:hypothetical protein